MEVGSAGSVKGMEKWNAMIVMVVEIVIIVMDMVKIPAMIVMGKEVQDVITVADLELVENAADQVK